MSDNDAYTAILQRLTKIETMLASESQTCPHRENIARAMNSIAERKALAVRVDILENETKDTLHKFELNAIKILALLGVSGAFGAGAEKLLQALILQKARKNK